MIYVSKILGEVYDLVGDQEVGCGLVLTNGHHDVTIRLAPEDAMKIVQLHAAALQAQPAEPPSSPPPDGEPDANEGEPSRRAFSPAPDPYDDPDMGVGSL